MGLKHFHIVFITAAVILCLGTAYWFLFSEKSEGGPLSLFFAVVSLIIGAGLVGYEVYFIQKSKNLPD
ncbi:MAG: hypothetical protein ACAI35_16105 [Candidatus Methylacidiphilales bacterium]|nr:hypothetical protein [Candidatus Methylacidiphilales bacterium]